MPNQNQNKKKKPAAQHLWFLHWLMAGFYLLLFITGPYMANLPRGFWYREPVYDFHKILGAVVMSLLLARIFVLLLVLQHKYKRRQPKLTLDLLQIFALHAALYFFMLLVPLSGFMCSNGTGHDVVIFGTEIVLPRLFAPNKQLGRLSDSAHFWLSYTFLVFIFLHMLDQRKYLRPQVRRFSKAAMAAISSGLSQSKETKEK